MKKSTVIALIVAACLIVAGCIILALSIPVVGFQTLSATFTQQEVSVQESFENISIDTADCNVTFVPYDGADTAYIVIREREETPHLVVVEDNTLKIQMQDLRQPQDYVGIHWQSMEMTVYLPEEVYASVQVTTDTGDVQIPADFGFASAAVNTDTGDIFFAAQVTEALSFHTDTGDTRVQDVACATLTCESDTGDIQLQDCDAAELDIQTDTGEVLLRTVLLTGQMNIMTTTGDVNILSCDAESVEIQTNTGDVFGSFLTSKWFQASSDTGDITVPMTRDGGVCSITTNTGDITFS